MTRKSFENDVFPYFRMNRKDFLNEYYIKRKMSDIEILEMIEEKTGARFSRVALLKWHRNTNISTRNPHKRFDLATKKHRFKHESVASKINYIKRSDNIDYTEVTKKMVNKILGKKRNKSIHFPMLLNLLDAQGKKKEDLANHLNVSVSCVKSWSMERTKIHPDYWPKLESFFNMKIKDILAWHIQNR